MGIPVLNTLLKKLVIQTATTHGLAYVNSIATRQRDRAAYIHRVLTELSPAGRRHVADLCRASDSPGQKQLEAILTVFESLSPADQASFIESFHSTSSLQGAGQLTVNIRTVWEPGHIPPIVPP